MQRYTHESSMPFSADHVFAWHARPGALERLLPPWQPVQVEQAGGIAEGETVVLRLGPPPLSVRWVARHGTVEPGRSFHDVQVSGPFAAWRHTHRFIPEGSAQSRLRDEIEYALPLARAADPVAGGHVRASLERVFRFRHERTRQDLERHAAAPASALRIAITGASGLVGRSLAAFLTTGGHRVIRIGRRATGVDAVAWNPERGELDRSALEGLDAVVHLAGESIAGLRWSHAKRRAIRESRVHGTDLLCRALASLERPPRVLVSASAIGIYGARRPGGVHEESPAGSDFLARVCVEWEAVTAPAAERGIRVATPRIGVVLSARGGMLARLLTPFRLGLGGPVGSGRQPISWVMLDDVVGAIHFALHCDRISGPFNVVAPRPVAQRELARVLAHVLRRPAIVPLPAIAVRTLLGEMGDALLLGGVEVASARLERAGFRFLHADLESALRFELGRLDEAGPHPA